MGTADNYGLAVNSAGGSGLYVNSAGYEGVLVNSTGDSGFYVASAGFQGVYVLHAYSSGLYIWETGFDGVDVVHASNDGLHVYEAGYNGVYAHTGQTSHEWGVYTPDKIYAGSGLAGAGPSMIVAQNGDEVPLEPGDVVVVSGAGAPFADSGFPAPLVRRAGIRGAVAGVVYAHFAAEEAVEEIEHNGEIEERTHLETHSTEGSVAQGEYVTVIVLGQAQVKASSLAGDIAAGDLLAVSADGQAVLLMAGGYLPGSLVRTAMEPLGATESSGLIWGLVNPR